VRNCLANSERRTIPDRGSSLVELSLGMVFWHDVLYHDIMQAYMYMGAEGAKIEAPKELRSLSIFGGGLILLIFDLLIAHFDGFSGAAYCFSLQFEFLRFRPTHEKLNKSV